MDAATSTSCAFTQITKLAAAFARDDRNEILALSHTIKGAAANVGACRMQHAARIIETGIRANGTPAERAALLEALRREFAILEQELGRS